MNEITFKSTRALRGTSVLIVCSQLAHCAVVICQSLVCKLIQLYIYMIRWLFSV